MAFRLACYQGIPIYGNALPGGSRISQCVVHCHILACGHEDYKTIFTAEVKLTKTLIASGER